MDINSFKTLKGQSLRVNPSLLLNHIAVTFANFL